MGLVSGSGNTGDMPLQHVRAVFFDAVGTILHPAPGVAEAYWTTGMRFGSRLSLQEVRARIKTAFALQEDRFAGEGHRTNEEAEEVRWRGVVAECLPDVADPEGCFRQLHAHFGDPGNWVLSPGLEVVLETLDGLGLVLGVASNFDERLRSVSAGFPCLSRIRHWVISSEVGWRKPAGRFYDHLVAEVGLPAKSILLVGDDPINDLEAPVRAGLQGLLVHGPECLSGLADQLSRAARKPVRETVG